MPFTLEAFLANFAAYNQAVHPMQSLLGLVAVTMALLALRGSALTDRTVSGLLALLWLWTGTAYHLLFFTRINPAAYLFALLCLIQAAVLLYSGVLRGRLAYRPARTATGYGGGLLMLYALVIYPLLGPAFGHVYPQAPTFGAPCPTTIFTLGLLLWASRGLPLYALAVPALWSLIGGSATLLLGMKEDAGLLLAGLLSCVLVLHDRRRAKLASSPGRMTGNARIATNTARAAVQQRSPH